jgi:hypothetical protein
MQAALASSPSFAAAVRVAAAAAVAVVGMMGPTQAGVSWQAVGVASLASHSWLHCKQTSWQGIGQLTVLTGKVQRRWDTP